MATVTITNGVKFSEFADGAELQVGDQVVGLRAGINDRFNFPATGIKDSSGNFLIGYGSVPSAVNYVNFTSAATTMPVIVGAAGTDVNISIELTPKGAGSVIANSDTLQVGQDIQHIGNADNKITFGTDAQDFQTGGTSRLDLDNSGLRIGGSGSRVTEIINDNTQATATATNLSTALAMKTYVDSAVGAGIPTIGASTDDALVRWDGVLGAAVQNSVGILSDLGALSGLSQLDVDNIRIDGNTISSTGGGGNVNIDTVGGFLDLNATTGVNKVLDEDDMASDDATALATQQSIKAYTDSVKVADYIVGPNAEYTTIQSAIDQAVLDGASVADVKVVLVTPGTYTENVAFASYVTVTTAGSGASDGVTILGACTYNAGAGGDVLSIAGIRFTTSGASPAFSLQGTNFCTVFFNDCVFVGLLGTAFEATNPSGSAQHFETIITTDGGNRPFEISGGECYFNGGFTFAAGSPGLSTGTGIVIVNSGTHFATYEAAGTAQLNLIHAIVISITGATPLTIGATAFANVGYTIFSSTAASGFWATGTGTLRFGVVTPNGILTLTIDPALTVVPLVSEVSSMALIAQSVDLDMNTNSIINVVDPVNPQDAATKAYVDGSLGGLFPWNEVLGTSQAMAVNNGYIANNAALVTLTLPATATIGQTVQIAGKGAGLFTIAQNAGQTIRIGSSSTTTGVGGSLTATAQYDSIELVCITANTDWIVQTAPQGNFTIV